MGISKAEADSIDTYICPNCQQKEEVDPIAQKELSSDDFVNLLKIVRSLQVTQLNQVLSLSLFFKNHFLHKPYQFLGHIINAYNPLNFLQVLKHADRKFYFRLFSPTFLYSQGHKMAWPFLTAVDPKDVPDYYKVIKEPMGRLFLLMSSGFFGEFFAILICTNNMM